MRMPFSTTVRSLVAAAAWAAIIIGVLLAVPLPALAQCALCRDTVASSTVETREAMNYAIIGLAFMPYGVAAVAAWTLSPALRSRVRSRLRRLGPRHEGESR